MQHLRWYDLLSSILFSSVKDLKVLSILLNLLNWSFLSFFPQVQQVVYVLFGWLITWCLLPVYCSSMISSSLWEVTWFFCNYYVQPRLLYCYFVAMRSWRSWEFVVSQRRSSLFRTELGRDNKLLILTHVETCLGKQWEYRVWEGRVRDDRTSYHQWRGNRACLAWKRYMGRTLREHHIQVYR